MKAKLFIAAAAALLMLSCQKEVELESTFVQLKTKSVWDGNPIGNVEFSIKSPYSNSNYGLEDTTNDYGNYNGSYINVKRESYELRLADDYYLVGGPRVLQGSTENILELEVAELGVFKYELNCSLNGIISNIKRERLQPIAAGSPVSTAQEGQSHTYYNPSCAHIQADNKIFTGQWLITYQKKPAGSVLWTNYADTVNVVKGDTTVLQINY